MDTAQAQRDITQTGRGLALPAPPHVVTKQHIPVGVRLLLLIKPVTACNEFAPGYCCER